MDEHQSEHIEVRNGTDDGGTQPEDVGGVALNRVVDQRPGEEDFFDYPKAEAIGHAVNLEVGEIDRSDEDPFDRREREDGYTEKVDALSELYDLNPEAFANKPTAEFMKEGREYSRLLYNLEYAQEGLTWARETADAARDAIKLVSSEELKRGEEWYRTRAERAYSLAASGSFSRKFAEVRGEREQEDVPYILRDDILSWLGASNRVKYMIDDETLVDRFMDLSKTVYEGRLDRTPRQNIEAFADFIGSIGGDLEPEVAELQQRLDDIRAKYRPQSHENGEAEN